MKELCPILNISQNLSTAYHPQTDGQSERVNQRVEQYLRIYGNDEQNDWADLLALAQFTHNTWPNESTKQTPFDLLIGHTPTMIIEEKDIAIPEVARRKEWLKRNRLRAQAALRNAQRLVMQRTSQKKGERHYKGCYAQALGVVGVGSLSVELSWRIKVRSGRPSCCASQGQNHGVRRGCRGSEEVRQSA